MIPTIESFTDRQLGLFTATQARLYGMTTDELRRDVRRGALIAVRRGIYCGSDDRAKAPEARHLQDAMAAILASSQRIVASHWTAAHAHGLPLIRPLPERPEVVTNREHMRALSGVRLFSGALHEGHVVDAPGLPRTTIARTISDVARTRSVDDALVMADHAFREGWCTPDDVWRVVRDGPTWKGIVWTKRVLEYAQPLNESPGETLSLLRMRRHALPLPTCQLSLLIDGHRVRPDFVWVHLGVVGEFDGAVKYSDRSVLLAEKRREDLLRAAGLVVVRWGWADVVGRGDEMAVRIRRGMADAASRAPVDVSRYVAAA